MKQKTTSGMPQFKFWNWVKDDESGTRTLYMNGVIAEESWFDDDVTPKMFKEELNAGQGDIVIWLNSPGGDCIAASQIYAMLMDYPSSVTVKIDGIAASAASVIAMAGTTVLMAPTALMMIHNPLTVAIGDILSQNGVSIDTMNTAMKSMTAAMADLDMGGKKGQETLAKLGVTTADLKNLKQEEIFEKAVVALQKMPEGYEKARLAQQLFGKQGQEMLPMLNQSKGSIEELKAKAHELGMVMSDEAVNAGVKYTDSMDTLKRSFAGVKNSIGAEMLPGMTMVTESLTGLITGQEGAGDKLREGAKAIIDSVSNMLPRILDVVFSIISSVAEVAPGILGALVKGIVDNLPQLIGAAVNIIKTLLTALIDALPQITEGALQLILALVNGIIANLPALVEAALNMIVTLALGIGDALPELIPAIIDAIILIVETLLGNMDKILDAAMKIIMGLAKGLMDALPKLIDALPRIIEGIINFITNNLPKMIEMGIKLVVMLAFGLIKAIPQLIEAIPQIIVAILGGLGEAVGSVGEVGLNIVKGLWDGINDAGAWLWDKISGFFSGVVNKIKDFFGIASPSKLMENEVGSFLAQGVGEGFVSTMQSVTKDMQKAIPSDFDTSVNINRQISASSSGSQYGVSGIDYSQMANVFINALSRLNLKVVVDGNVLGELVNINVAKEVYSGG